MPWREDWRHQERPSADRIPKEYRMFGSRSNSLILGYFAGVVGLSYVLLSTIGTRSVLIAGLPALMWIMVGIALLILLGLYFTVYQHRPNGAASIDPAPATSEEVDR